MDCTRTSVMLSAFLDGELAPSERTAVEQHLEGCATCRAELERLQALGRALHSLEGVALPFAFARRVRQAAEQSREPAAPVGVGRFMALNRTMMRVAAVLMAAAGLWVGVTVGGSAFERASTQTVEDSAQDAEFDLQVEPLSVAPPGSMAEAYLAFLDEMGVEEAAQ